MNYKKTVKLERIIAVIIDGFIVGFISAIFSMSVMYLFSGSDNAIDYFINEFNLQNIADLGNSIYATHIFVSFLGAAIYYIYIPFRFNGKTLGKMVMRIKAIDDEGQNPTFKIHAIRAIRMYGYFLSVPFLFTLFLNDDIHTFIDSSAFIISSIVMVVSFFMILGRDDERGLHDLIAKTYVVDQNYDPEADASEAATQEHDWVKGETEEDEDDGFSLNKNDDPWEK